MSTAQLVDLTSCEKILRYLQKDPAIEMIVEVVDPNLKIETVGDIMVAGDIDKMTQLIRAHKVIRYADWTQCRTPLKNSVRCLRLTPFYLIKNLNRLYV